MFERLMNLDVELRCLGTKAFVAKEQFVNDVFYSKPKKKKDSDKKESNEVTDLMEQIDKAKKEGKDTAELEAKLKAEMDKYLAGGNKPVEPAVTKESISALMVQIDEAKEAGEDTAELEAKLKAEMDKYYKSLSTPAEPAVKRAAVRAVEPPAGSGQAVRAVEPPAGSGQAVRAVNPVPVVTVGEGATMDFSGQVQKGVTYAEPTVNPMKDEMQKNPDLQAAIEASKGKKPAK